MPVVQKMQTQLDNSGEDLLKVLDAFQKVAKTKDAAKKKRIKEIKKENKDIDAAGIQELLKEDNGKKDEDYVTESEFTAAFTKGISLKDENKEKIKCSAPEAKKLFKAADTSQDGFVDFKCATRARSPPRRCVRHAHRVCIHFLRARALRVRARACACACVQGVCGADGGADEAERGDPRPEARARLPHVR